MDRELYKMKVINLDPLVWSIPYSRTVESDILDCKFFDIKHIEILERLNQMKWKLIELKDLATVFIGQTPERYEYVDEGIPIIKVMNVTNLGLRWDDVSFIPEGVVKKWGAKGKQYIQTLDILIPTAAHSPEAIGEKVDIVSFIPNNFEKVLCVAELAVVRIKSEEVDPFYLLAYLRSKYGRIQIKSIIRGQTAHIYPFDLERLKVSLPPSEVQKRIGDMIRQAEEARRDSW